MDSGLVVCFSSRSKSVLADLVFIGTVSHGVSVQCLDQQNQFDLLGEAFGVKAVGRRGGGVLPDLGLGGYERCTRYVSSPREKAWSLC